MVSRDALISDCGLWRYTLTRTWDPAKPALCILGLNPSVADAFKDDPTVCREIAFADRWGYGSLLKGNIFAFRSTDPKNMKAAKDPVGPENDRWIRWMSEYAKTVVAAWGVHGAFLGRQEAVSKLLAGRPLWCLGTTKEGYPRHPLYVRGDTPLVRWESS